MIRSKSNLTVGGFAEDPGPLPAQKGSRLERVRDRESAPRQAVNLTANSVYLAEAKDLGLGLSSIFDAALKQAVNEAKAAAFAEENAAFLEWSNKEIEENGLWSDGLRLF